ncbi:MAG TPA: ATP-binding protein [Burkholderiales bacterium]|nr:ATP-binding protein [Burkholderiales bacterium]
MPGDVAASLRRLLAAPEYPEDAERSAQARLFNVVALAALAALSAAVSSQIYFGQTGIPFAMTLTALAVTAACMAVARLGALRLARALLPPVVLAACMVVIVARDGLHDNVMAAVGAVLLMAGVLLQRRALALFTAAVVFMIFAVAYAEIAGILQNRFSRFTDWRHAVGLALFLLFIAVTVRALMDSMVATLRDAQQKRAALATSYARLEGQAAALRESEARFAKAIETMAEGIVLLDMDGKVRLCNQAAERILGMPVADIVSLGVPIGGQDAVRADGSPFPPEERPVPLTLRTGQSRTGVVMGLVRDHGAIRWLSVNSAALFADDAAKPYAVFTTFFDISGLKHAEQALRAHAGQLRHLSHRLFEVEENERRRLSRELHDRIGANLTALSLNLRLARGEWAKASPRLDDSEKLLDSTAQLVRDVLTDMRPPGLDELGLLAALREHAEQVAQRSGLAVEVQGEEPRPRLPAATEIALFRVAQEAMTNIVKHARARGVTVSLCAEDGLVTLTVEDDGAGFDDEARAMAAGMGMASMRERAEAVGARPRIESAPGRGTRVIVEVPHVAAPQPQAAHA